MCPTSGFQVSGVLRVIPYVGLYSGTGSLPLNRPGHLILLSLPVGLIDFHGWVKASGVDPKGPKWGEQIVNLELEHVPHILCLGVKIKE